jgi:tetratricopeptide (TPR) repeat protein
MLEVKCKFNQRLVIMACVILAIGCATTQKISASESMLFETASRGGTDTVQTLLAGGSDVNAENPMGKTSLTWAKRKGYKQIVQLVKKAEAEQVKQTPRDADFYHNRGLTHARQLRFDEAISDYTKAIEISPGFAEAYYIRGLVYCEKGEYDKAISDFSKVIKLKPRFARAYTSRGLTYAGQAQYDKTIADFNKAIQINPRFAAAYTNRGVFMATKVSMIGSSPIAPRQSRSTRRMIWPKVIVDLPMIKKAYMIEPLPISPRQ